MTFAPFRMLWLILVGMLAVHAESPPPVPHAPRIPDRSFSSLALGVLPDQAAPVTAALQAAIRHVADEGGGQLVLAPGVYVSGPLTLASRLDFHLEKGAVLKLLPRESAYPATATRYVSFLSGLSLSDLRLSGEGVIDGQGEPWWRAFRAKELDLRRPQLIALERCERVELADLTFLNPPNTHLSLRLCRSVRLAGLTLLAPADSPNTDGINISGKDYLISRCRIATGDDNIVILTHSAKDWVPPVSERFIIRDCVFGVGHGLSIGSYTSGGVRDVLAERCRFEGTTSGIRLKADRDRGGLVENLVYRDITMRDVKTPVFISSYYPKEPKSPALDAVAPVTEKTPRWKNVLIENLTATGSENSFILWGLPERPLEDVVIRQTTIASERGARFYYAGNLTLDARLQTLAQPASDHFPPLAPKKSNL